MSNFLSLNKTSLGNLFYSHIEVAMLEKSYITMDVENTYEEVLREMQKIIKWLAHHTHPMKFERDLHITLDFLGACTLEEAQQKLTQLGWGVSRDLTKSIATLDIGQVKSFISHGQNKRIFYLEVIGGNAFFAYLKSQGYTITAPHITLFTTSAYCTERETEDILKDLNSNRPLAKCIAQLHLDTNHILLKNKPKDTAAELIETLTLPR